MVRETEISTQFGFKIYEVAPMKGVYLIKTDRGNKCLKKVGYGLQKLMYIYKAKEHIIDMGYDRIDRNELTPQGAPYAFVNDDIYVVTNWINGRECDFKKDEELEAAAKALAEFHLSARNFTPEDGVAVRCDIGRLPNTFEKRLSTLNKMREIARKNKKKTEFDILYLSNVEFYSKLAQKAIKTFNMESYNRVCDYALKNRVICHHDYTYHNILFDENENVHVIDFDYCKWEIQVYDVSTIMVKALKRLDWDMDKAKLILGAYNSVNPISRDEYNVLKSLLTFPQRFWRLANRYYYKEAGWNDTTFIKKMKEIVDEREKYMNLISNMDDIVKDAGLGF